MSDTFFLTANNAAYQKWRASKLSAYPVEIEDVTVDIDGPFPTVGELRSISQLTEKTNFAIYRLRKPEDGTKGFVRSLGEKLGLADIDDNLCADEDSVTSLQVMDTGRHTGYIPYTSRRLSWHTDGYYNTPEQQVRGVVLHCVRPAAEGGENLLLDHEIAYLQLRDENPDYIKVLMRNNAMTIPPNIENGQQIRGEQTGPVFSIEKTNGHLHMRYSARTRNIVWFDDELTREAVACLNSLLTENNPYVFSYRMQAGEGIISNNVLHNRTSFKDSEQEGQGRLLYRARYFNRVKG
ncbi:MAG: TauD/TfdA family dioxygenase [Gammaproteobacteria bacterium]|nr:TauD/TfdA family dioxygenase [Gammaproteobacteria bacterium]